MADIPGLIEGAAQGAGLGIQFLKHLSRTRLLLHVVDACPADGEVAPAAGVRAIERELAAYSAELGSQPRWLVVNKLDLLPAEARRERAEALAAELEWQAPVFGISAVTGEGTAELVRAVMTELSGDVEGG
jgi:GTP-binding protein